MISEPFDPSKAEAWISHGRPPEHAAILSDVWQRFPDLPPGASADARIVRMRDRALALRPVMEAMSRAAEADRQARNFAFTEDQLESGRGDERDRAILRARSLYDYDWNGAVRYSSGWFAARAGWEPEARRPGCRTSGTEAYDQGFLDGGGNRDDPFDAARRAFLVSPAPQTLTSPDSGRPRPSDLPKPSDEPRPARWCRRLLILGAPEVGHAPSEPASQSALLLPILQDYPGHEAMKIIVIANGGFHDVSDAPGPGDLSPGRETALRDLLAGGDFDDCLVAAQGRYLALLDTHRSALPLCRTMERTRNTILQQRAHFRLWLARGLQDGQTLGAGHIRWGKAVKGLTGKLGEFTSRYGGKAPTGGHRIVIELPCGSPALGYETSRGEPLSPEIVIGNRAHMRKAMAAHLRAFAGATRLTAQPTPHRHGSFSA